MNAPEDKEGGPSRRMLLKSTVLTFIAAIVVTVLFVLPAEYGVDPTGLGARLGLMRLAGAEAPGVDAAPRIVQGTFPVVSPDDEFDFYEPETLGDPFSRPQNRPYRSEKIVIPLEMFEQVEVKAVLKQGDAIIYSWKMTEGETVYSDFHADPHDVDNYPELYYVRYHESEEGAGSGSLVAPFTGNHGWYWLNIEENPVRIELDVHGYFDSIEEIMRSFQ